LAYLWIKNDHCMISCISAARALSQTDSRTHKKRYLLIDRQSSCLCFLCQNVKAFCLVYSCFYKSL